MSAKQVRVPGPGEIRENHCRGIGWVIGKSVPLGPGNGQQLHFWAPSRCPKCMTCAANGPVALHGRYTS